MAIIPAVAVGAGLKSLIGPLISGASSIFGASTAKSQQKKANQFNLEMWNRQNAYNSPVEQMRRLKEAGLNPNLIYGTSGNTGNAGSAPQFTAMSESGYKPVNSNDILSTMQAFTDWDIKKASEDKIQTAIELDKARILDVQASAIGKSLANITGKEKARIASQMADISLDAAKANVNKTLADTQFTLNEDQRKAIMNDRNVLESVERVYTMQTGRRLTEAQIKNLGQDYFVKKLQAEMAKSGITPDMPWYTKAIEMLIEHAGKKGMFGENSGWPSLWDSWKGVKNNVSDWWSREYYKKKYPGLYPKN